MVASSMNSNTIDPVFDDGKKVRKQKQKAKQSKAKQNKKSKNRQSLTGRISTAPRSGFLELLSGGIFTLCVFCDSNKTQQKV